MHIVLHPLLAYGHSIDAIFSFFSWFSHLLPAGLGHSID
jgi:hypothetical protein